MNAGTSLHARMFARLINLRYARRMQQNPKQIRKQSVIAQKSVARSISDAGNSKKPRQFRARKNINQGKHDS